MSSPITVLQHPLQLTCSKVDHVYSFTSSTPQTNPEYKDYRFVADIYIDTQTVPRKVARLIFAPNSYGVGTINVQRVIENYVQGNARTEALQYTSHNSADYSVYGHLGNLSGQSQSNAYSNRNTPYNPENDSFPSIYQIRDYRVMVGEQYFNPATNSTVVNISTQADIPNSGFYSTVANLPATWGPSDGNSVQWFEAGGNIPANSGIIRGVEYAWTNNSGTVVYQVGTTSTPTGSFTPGNSPTVGDIFKVQERYTGIRFTFAWYDFSGTGGYIGWALLNVQGGTSKFGPEESPAFVHIWPGTSLKAGSYINDIDNNQYWGDVYPTDQQLYWEVEKYRIMELNPAARINTYGQFLTTFGPDTKDYVNDGIAGTVTNSRHRRHHPECPILVSFFNGTLSNDSDMVFINQIDQISYLFKTATDTSFSSYKEVPIDIVSPNGITQQDRRIRYANFTRPDLAGGSVGVWCGNTGEQGQWDQADIRSEFVVFDLAEDNCMSDPVHILFMNRQGVWDTYTFDRKAIEEKKIKRESYAQGGIQDLQFYSQLSTQRRDVIYDQKISEFIDVDTWYLEDNDKAIIMDLFQSPEVYIMKNQSFFNEDGTFRGPKTYNPYLLPVTVDVKSIKEFKNRYNKVFKYSFSFEYSPINQYRTQG